MKLQNNLFVFLISSVLLFLPACASTQVTESPTPESTLSTTILPAIATAVEATTQAREQDSEPVEGESKPTTPIDEIMEALPTRTPMPTVTPGLLYQEVERLVGETKLAKRTFLGLGIYDWIYLGVSLLAVLLIYLFATWLVKRIFPRLVRRTGPKIDDRLLKAAGGEIRWLVVMLTLQFVTLRLVFIEAEAKVFLTDIYFLVILFLAVRIIWVVIRLAEEEAYARLALDTERGKEMSPLIKLSVMLLRIMVGLLAATILLSHFGIDITAFMAALGLGGLAISLAARDTIADAIAGFIILIDRPFRVGDRIEIKAAETWGDVVEIGLRTTRIRTRDNRMVIIPNSTIGSNEVINYSYPDPEYRIETRVGIAYGTPIEEVRQLLAETVAKVEGVLDKKPVDVLYMEMGDFAMIFRVRWWVESFVDTRRVEDRVHTAIQNAIDQAGIQSPYPTSVTQLKIDLETARELRSRADDSGSPLEPPPSSYSPEER